jgi:hypothetical protein
MTAPKWLTDLLTSRNGVTFDVIRVFLALACFVLLGLAIWDVVVNEESFNALTFGSGVAALFAGGGVGIGAKRNDEPDQ